MPDKDVLEVRVSVVFAGLVMLVVGPQRSDLLEHRHQVGAEPWFIVVHIYAGGDVHRGDQTEPLLDAAGADGARDVVGDPDDLCALLGVHREVIGVRAHGSPPVPALDPADVPMIIARMIRRSGLCAR